MPVTLPPLPYSYEALEPHIGAATLETHYDKHHRAYVDKTNQLIAGGPFAEQPLEEIVRKSEGTLFNNAGQAWNHNFYWRSMRPNGGGAPSGALGEAITKAFGSVDDFKREFAEAANNQFGSGWAWLALDREGSLRIVSTGNADNPLTKDMVPLLTCDVWEHAYYLDYRNQRARYTQAFVDHLINWAFAEENLQAARPGR
ncbi:MAG TPA: superoxide dismutase [Gammaproteobacteria bacterium]